MPGFIDLPMEGANNTRKDDAQRIGAGDEGPRTSDSGEHCSVSLSPERTYRRDRIRQEEPSHEL